MPEKSNAVLQNGRRLETDRLGGGDLHCFPGLRVAALAGCTLFYFESSKSDDLDFFILFHTCSDGREDGFESFVGSALGGVIPESGLDGFNKFSFVHGGDVSENGTGGWQEKIR